MHWQNINRSLLRQPVELIRELAPTRKDLPNVLDSSLSLFKRRITRESRLPPFSLPCQTYIVVRTFNGTQLVEVGHVLTIWVGEDESAEDIKEAKSRIYTIAPGTMFSQSKAM